MSFIELAGLGEAKEPAVQPEGKYFFTVVDVFQYTKEETGNEVIRVKHAIDGVPDAMPVTHWLSLPGPNDEQDKVSIKILMLKRYLNAAGIPFEANGFNKEDLYGANFESEMTLSEPNDQGTQFNNLRLPRLPYEG